MTQPRLLLVDPEILIRTPLAEYLRECGYEVVEATSTDEAREVLRARGQDIDAMLVDVGSSREDGFALASWARRSYPAINVALAGTLVKVAEAAGELCDDGPALAKPYDHQLVLQEIRRLLARGRQGPSSSE